MKLSIDITRRRVFIAVLVVAVAPFAVAASGLVSIAASSGHFSPVGWFLHWTLKQTVARRSLLVEKPAEIDLSDPSLVQRAAGHFATGCAPCHAAPGVPQSEVVAHMTPAPPRLDEDERIGRWTDRELYWIGLHGIKYSGMPAWPTQDRPDEIWPLVAFLRALPHMTPQRYRELALGYAPGDAELEAGGDELAGLDGIVANAIADCARCHGIDGLGRGPKGAFPIIAGQPREYLEATLLAYRAGARHSGYMQTAASRYDDAILAELATYYAGKPAAPGRTSLETAARDAAANPMPVSEDMASATAATGSSVDDAAATGIAQAALFGVDPSAATGIALDETETLALGRRIAEFGLPDRKIAACDSCHDPVRRSEKPLFPSLDGQPEWYLKTHLELWKEGQRGGTAFAHLMTPIAVNMTSEQIAAVSKWYRERPVR